ncbi:MAG: rane protein of unknown function [Candidatus Saccharibacteria bacterium]|nr:rane protein of unknown function [Candidatus Saccharibacteria bacterium]
MKRLKIALIMMLFSLFGFGIVGLRTADALAPSRVVANLHADACSGLTQIDTTQDCNSDGGGVQAIVKAIVTIISYIVGIAAIIIVLLSGLRYITSGGDAAKVSSAKNALIYALIGLAIAGLAQALVHFALNTADNATTVCPSNSKLTKADAECK